MEDPFLQRMDSELAGWTDPVRRLRDAVENDEFELYCQPILQFAGDERYPMAEVLVRLREEERALLPPGEFLPVFEIDESDALLRLGACKRFSDAYRAIGGALLIDGFGHRAVSFVPVKELGVKFVKVDGSICRKVLSSDTARNKLNAILRVGQTLGYAIVAECVEDQDVLLRLKAMGVAYAQGFGIYQP